MGVPLAAGPVSDLYRHARAGTEGSTLRDGVGYHDIPGYPGRVHREGTAERVAHILRAVEVAGLRGVDIGCGPGGVTVGLARAGADMVGVDHDPSALAIGREVAEAEGLPVRFVAGDVADVLPGLLADHRPDVAVWLSQYMWLVKQHGPVLAEDVLAQVAATVPTLVFETAQGRGDGMAGAWALDGPAAVREMLARHFPYVLDIGRSPGDWEGQRTVFFCRRCLTVSGTVTAGYGSAAHDVERGRYRDVLDYDPYPGTLNLLAGRCALPPAPITVQLPTGGRTVRLWPARIARIGGLACHLMTGGDSADVVELLAPVRLRDALGVHDGDPVTVTIEPAPGSEGPAEFVGPDGSDPAGEAGHAEPEQQQDAQQ